MKVGVIGLGVVGAAIYDGLIIASQNYAYGYDINKNKSKNSYSEILNTNLVFICVPTPMKNNTLSTDIVESCLKELCNYHYTGVVVIKSTLPLGAMSKLRKHDLRLIYSPEFLKAKSALNDFLRQIRVICSGSKDDIVLYQKVLSWVDNSRFIVMDDPTAELMKLTMNAFTATKISFLNEIEEIALKQGANVDQVFEVLRNDPRCATPFTTPHLGPFGGVCLVKDTLSLANSLISNTLLREVLSVNRRTEARYRKRS